MSGELSSPSPALSRDERRVRAAQDVLRTTIRDLYLGHFHHEVKPEPVKVQITMRVHPGEQWKLAFEPPLLDQLLPQLADSEAARDVVVPGRVYCFRCGSSGCEHAGPGSAREVFCGYDATGRPEWQELAQALIDAKHEEVDCLFATPPQLVTMFQFGRELKGRQLLTFGKASLSYSILAQVTAGYFAGEGDPVAMSLQVVESRDREGAVVLTLNPVAWNLTGARLVAWLSLERNAGLFRSLQIAGRELEQIQAGVRQARAESRQDRANQLMGRIPGVARRLAEDLARSGRQGGRRTRHVEHRRQHQRPVHKALEDAAAASLSHWHYDVKSKTFVVVGERGRVHAFNEGGRHVTSFLVKPSALDFRLRTGRWRPAESEEIAALQGQFRQVISNEQ